MSKGGLIIAAPASGSGKTTVTLGLLRALGRIMPVRGAKSGPDYIDPRFHEAATGRPAFNLDAWAMPEAQIKALAAGEELLVIEGAMGLFDGAPPDGRGSVADLARILTLPVVLVVDAGKMAQSVSALVAGFAGHDPKVQIAGVILNNVASPRHERMLRGAVERAGQRVLGAVPRDADLALPSRHLGLVQAREHAALEAFISHAADIIERCVDLAAVTALARALPAATPFDDPAPGRRIAVAHDDAFAFAYPHMLRGWQDAGALVLPFSPLANDPVPESADLVFLPGGYPELHAQTLSEAKAFMQSLRNASQSVDIYGECGGYMVLGESLIDADGTAHAMAGLLGLQTSFQNRRLTLGYRQLRSTTGPFSGSFRGHEFHYATTIRAEGAPLFEACDAESTELPPMGLVEGRVSGSFAHVIAPANSRPVSG